MEKKNWQSYRITMSKFMEVNNTFRVLWLVSSEVISPFLFTSEPQKKDNVAYLRFQNVTNKVTLWSASYLTCIVYTKTIIYLTILFHFGK